MPPCKIGIYTKYILVITKHYINISNITLILCRLHIFVCIYTTLSLCIDMYI